MKSVSRNKFMLCCRPDMDLTKRPVGHALAYIAADSQQHVPSPPKRTLSRVIRAVLFEVILSKSVRDKKKGLRSSKRSNSLSREGSSWSSSSSSYASDENKTEYLEDKETKPNSMEALLSSSVSESRNGPKHVWRKSNMDTKQNKITSVKESINSGVFLFVISLAITVLWGKIWAIVFTSLWIYFLPLPSGVDRIRRPETVEGRLRKARSGGSYHKKRVIMEGLLQRSNRRAERERDGEIKA